jgi:ribose transport system ATP-binding protein
MPSEEAGTREPVVRLRGISKEFPGVKAVDGVNLEILPGEVHALRSRATCGESRRDRDRRLGHRPG